MKFFHVIAGFALAASSALATVDLMADSTNTADTADSAKAAQDWLRSVSSSVPPDQAALLQLAQATLLHNTVRSKAWDPYPGVEPAVGWYDGVWNWDTAFHAFALSYWDPTLAREQFDILFAHQRPDGMLPDAVMKNGKVVEGTTKPPVIAWSVAVVDHRAPDTDYLRGIYPKLIKVGEFFENERGGKKDGLFFYAGQNIGWDSGWDDSIRWDNGYHDSTNDNHRLWAIDLNCYMVTHYEALAYIAGRLNLPAEQTAWQQKADDLAKRINDKLWNAKLGFYVDRDRVTGAYSTVLSPAGFVPLFIHIAPPDRATLCAKIAADPAKFYPGMPTATYDTPGYNPNGFWRGPAWLNTSFFAMKGLHDYGYTDLAEKMRQNLFSWIEKDPAGIWEHYNTQTGKGLGPRGFGWSAAFTICFIEDWDNNNLTWLFPPVPK
jgi:putative isomerase